MLFRSGMGAHFGLHLVEAATDDALASLSMPLLATSSHAARALHELTLPWPCAWVMGHEERPQTHLEADPWTWCS